MQRDRRAKLTVAASLGFIDMDFLLSLWADAPSAATVLCAHRVCFTEEPALSCTSVPSSLSGSHHIRQMSFDFLRYRSRESDALCMWNGQ